MRQLTGLSVFLIPFIGIAAFSILLHLSGHFQGRYIKKRKWNSKGDYKIGTTQVTFLYLLILCILIVLSIFLIKRKVRGIP